MATPKTRFLTPATLPSSFQDHPTSLEYVPLRHQVDFHRARHSSTRKHLLQFSGDAQNHLQSGGPKSGPHDSRIQHSNYNQHHSSDHATFVASADKTDDDNASNGDDTQEIGVNTALVFRVLPETKRLLSVDLEGVNLSPERTKTDAFVRETARNRAVVATISAWKRRILLARAMQSLNGRRVEGGYLP
ncbi:hypothetical protein QBC38DRAFT_460980 [Podospora fimiseda]|uniref:Uncharacterized protein n=1 Tax=Podospora fimiseda TaxID=252190 RepID=A0AAN6YQ51_9PEZI|nr:hypothetical protein QBC38DRAFT_460980 [Podospora fimiseda]